MTRGLGVRREFGAANDAEIDVVAGSVLRTDCPDCAMDAFAKTLAVLSETREVLLSRRFDTRLFCRLLDRAAVFRAVVGDWGNVFTAMTAYHSYVLKRTIKLYFVFTLP